MVGVSRFAIVVSILLLLVACSSLASSQPTDELQPHFNEAIVQVHRAEAAGATPSEVAELVLLLNKALEINEAALALNPSDAQHRISLLSQVDGILLDVQSRATQLERSGARRMATTKTMLYVVGGVGAFLSTIVYAWGVSLFHRYRIKRTLQMKVIPK
jgi:nucleotidyltransferase/DNA polymerase involved in DNA repair